MTNKMKVIICTTNPIKIEATKMAFESYFDNIEYEMFDMKPYREVLDQPMSRKETLDSALSRIKIIEKDYSADYYVSLEGGVDKDNFGAFLTGYVVIKKKKNGKISVSGGYRMPIPSIIFDKLLNKEEKELGLIIDSLAGIKNTKQKNGAIGLFTDNKLTRSGIFYEMVLLALIPFVNKTYQKVERTEETTL